MYPDHYRYTKEHEWVSPAEDGIVLVGITDHAQNQLGDIVYVDLPDEGESFDKDEEVASLESVKAVAEVFMPLAGDIVAINPDLDEQPEQVNQQPHEGGWLMKIKLADPSDLDGLMDAKAYAAFVAEETK